MWGRRANWCPVRTCRFFCAPTARRRGAPPLSLSLPLSPSHHLSLASQSSNWNGNYGYEVTNGGASSVNAPIVGSLAYSMPGYPQFTTASGGFPVAPARPRPPTFFPGLYGTFTAATTSLLSRAELGGKKKL